MKADKVRYAVVGLGHIAQVAVLPAFAHARENSELTAFISSDPDKLKELSARYGVTNLFSYDQYETALRSNTFDAVYLALPNDLHKDFAIAAAKAGIHVLCEKPMAISKDDCKQMIAAATLNKIKLMIAYRLHFERTNMKTVEALELGKIGIPKLFNSSFTLQVREDNIRTKKEHGGGPLFDIGIYCINAARYVFQEEPIEVMAMSVSGTDFRFSEIDESVSVMMKFPNDRLASFVCSFGCQQVSHYEVVGTKGSIRVDPAYEYADETGFELKEGKKEHTLVTGKRDQFAPELIHFSGCVLDGEEPRPSGFEGLADIRIIEAIQESIATGAAVSLGLCNPPTSKPTAELINEKPGVKTPELVNAQSGSKD
ncbi:Gfo/Idh/MocA family oxidoreductase [soil metagenome]